MLRTMRVCYEDGSFAEALIVGLIGRSMRALAAGVDDALEFTLRGDSWFSEGGLAVSFKFPPAVGDELYEEPLMVCIPSGGPCAAGGDCMLRRIAAANPRETVQ